MIISTGEAICIKKRGGQTGKAEFVDVGTLEGL